MLGQPITNQFTRLETAGDQPVMNAIEIALEESLKLQSHYAALLNQYDGGERIVFKSTKEWIDRLKEVGTIPSNKSVEPTSENYAVCKVCGIEHVGVRCPKIWG